MDKIKLNKDIIVRDGTIRFIYRTNFITFPIEEKPKILFAQ